MLGRPQARGKDVSISGPWSQLINWFVRTLIYRKKLFWVQPPCHTHESHWYFVILQIEANIFFLSPITRVLELNDMFANLTKNLEWHPGMGQCLHLSFFMLTVRKLDTNWIKLLWHEIYCWFSKVDRASRAERAPKTSVVSQKRVENARGKGTCVARQIKNHVSIQPYLFTNYLQMTFFRH